MLWPIALAGLAVACSGRADAPAESRSSNTPAASAVNPATAPVYMCPMDKDIRAHAPGTCPRCGMKLVTSVPDPVEYHLELSVTPPPLPNSRVRFTFDVFDPWKDNRVTKFSLVHEKLFHAFVVSQDLDFFLHGHPAWNGSAFDWDVVLPKAGMYRVLGDFYPEASAPQLLTKTVFVPGAAAAVRPLQRDYSAKQGENLRVEVETLPEDAVAGMPV